MGAHLAYSVCILLLALGAAESPSPSPPPAGMAVAPSATRGHLTGGAASLDELLDRFVAALASGEMAEKCL